MEILYSDVASERSSWDLSEYILFHTKKIIFYLKKLIFRWKINNFKFSSCNSYEILRKFIGYINSGDCIGKITSKSIRIQPDFI